jgi:hypothetical protein
MVRSIFVAALLVASAVASPFNSTRRTCGNELSSSQISLMEADFAAKKVSAKQGAVAAATLNVYFHVISKDSTVAGGNVP